MMDYAKSQLTVLLLTFLTTGAVGFLFDTTNRFTSRYEWHSWSSWSTCHYVDCTQSTTHTYTQQRHRACYDHMFGHTVVPTHCGSHHVEYQACKCAHWLTWSHWTTCSATCDEGHTSRTRHCASAQENCVGSSHETMSCVSTTCSPHWIAWSNWSACSASCGGGTTIRVRHCSSTSQTCIGDPFQTLTCGTGNCASVAIAVDGGWTTWGTWGVCSKSCGLGLKTRLRSCDDPVPTHGGKTCHGDSTSQTTCTLGECPIDGGWGDWTTWSTCAATCGVGLESRSRTCSNPAPQHGGRACSGNAVDQRVCESPACPGVVDGAWSSYTSRPCSVTCGTGVVVKFRSCSNPPPSVGGNDCAGSATEFSVCTEQDCPKDGGWTDWSDWTICNVVCGYGHIWRSRNCITLTPGQGDLECSGSANERQLCNNGACPDDLKTCYNSQISELINFSPYVVDVKPSPHVTCATPVAHQEASLHNLCQVTSSPTDWRVGIKMSGNCENTPLFVPLALISKRNLDRTYGILLDCHGDVIQLVDMSCNMQVKVSRLNTTENEYHIVLL